jgi:uncharacterized protein YkwD
MSRFALISTLAIAATTWFTPGVMESATELTVRASDEPETETKVLGETVYASDPVSELALFDATNRDRVRNRRRGYIRNDELDALAAKYAQTLVNTKLAHARDLSEGITQSWFKLGENLGRGRDVTAIHQALMASPTHRANVLDSGFTEIGIAAVKTEAGVVIVERFIQIQAAP